MTGTSSSRCPAFSWLRSTHDDFLGHFRRYSCGSLRKVIGGCPHLEIVDLHYFYAGILPAVVPIRLARRHKPVHGSDMKMLPGWLNGLLKWLARAELAVASRNRVAGLSVVALCRKVNPHPAHQPAAAPVPVEAPVPMGVPA